MEHFPAYRVLFSDFRYRKGTAYLVSNHPIRSCGGQISGLVCMQCTYLASNGLGFRKSSTLGNFTVLRLPKAGRFPWAMATDL